MGNKNKMVRMKKYSMIKSIIISMAFWVISVIIAFFLCYFIYLSYPANGLSLMETIIQSTQNEFIAFVPTSFLLGLLLCVLNIGKKYFFRKCFLYSVFFMFISLISIFLINYSSDFLGRNSYISLGSFFWIIALFCINFLFFITLLMPVFFTIQYLGKTIVNFKQKLVYCLVSITSLFFIWAFFINPYYVVYQANKITDNQPYCIMVSYKKNIYSVHYKSVEHIYNLFALSQKTPYEAYHQDNHGIKQYQYHTILISENKKINKTSYWNWSHNHQNFEPVSEKNCILYIDGTYDRASVYNSTACEMKCPENHKQDIFIKILNKIT